MLSLRRLIELLIKMYATVVGTTQNVNLMLTIGYGAQEIKTLNAQKKLVLKW